MAFSDTAYEKKERFSLLLLEPGEIYFQDFSAYYYPSGLSEQEAYRRRQKGRLKLCSKSVLFDPKDHKLPIIKFAFRDILAIDKWETPLLSRSLSLEGCRSDSTFFIESEQIVKMKEDNTIKPYTFERGYFKCMLSLVHSCTDDVVPHMHQLHRASTLPLGDQTAMINAIVHARQSRVKFDTSWLENLYETIVMETQADQITPLVINPGRLMLTSQRLYFQPFNNIGPQPVLKIKLSSISRIIKRRFLLKQVGLELYCRDLSPARSTAHMYLAFKDPASRNEVYDNLLIQQEVKLDDLGQENMTLRWQNRVISNFDYIMYLNSLADRSTNDLTQYPVFPWVLSNYTQPDLDLTDPTQFRDLSKPMGALDSDRLLKLLERYNEMTEPRFLYGSHYSTPGYILFYLARIAPEYMLCLQNGKFDNPDRMFNSIADAWKNCLTSMSDFKELIPEFYDSDGDFLKNNPLINFGTRQEGKPVTSVELPPWAESAGDFVGKMRAALDSDYVSEHLHKWIDLIFGYKQTGEEAENAYNVFYHLTYEGAVDLESIRDLNQRAALETQIMEFGQTPKQLFFQPHPPRKAKAETLDVSQGLTETSQGHSEPGQGHTKESRSEQPSQAEAEVVAIVESVSPRPDASVTGYLPTAAVHRLFSNACELQIHGQHALHKEAVTDLCWSYDGKQLFTVSLDGLLKMYSVAEQRQERSVSLSHMPLSSCVLLPDGKTVVVGGWDNYIYLHSLEFGRTLYSTYAHDDAVSDLDLGSDLLASASWDSTVKLWKLNTTAHKATTEMDILTELEHDTGVTCVSLGRDQSRIAVATKDGQLHIWNTNTQQLLLQQQGHVGEVHDLAFSPDESQVLTCGSDQCVRVVDIHTGTEIMSKNLPMELTCVCWDGKTVLGGTTSGHLVAWDLVQLKLLKHYQAHKGFMRCMKVSNEGQLATGGEDRSILIWGP